MSVFEVERLVLPEKMSISISRADVALVFSCLLSGVLAGLFIALLYAGYLRIPG